MSTDINLLRKGLIRLSILVVLFVAVPVMITMGFKGIEKITTAPKIYLGYSLLIFGFLGLVFTLYFGFKTFSILRKAFFNED